MPKLRNPDTGKTVWATAAGAEVLRRRGYLDAAKTAQSAQDPPSEKPLEKLKLTELLDHAEASGVDADTLEALRKPGTSKAQVIEAITTQGGTR
jgi:hypothetical protein